MIKLGAEFLVPFPPDRNATFGQRGVILIRAVGGADRLADIGGSSERMGDGAGIDQNNCVAAIL